MKGSQELIAYFKKREEELGEKATKFNLFLEGYAEGYNDTKAEMINKACEWWYIKLNTLYPNDLLGDVVDDFRKSIEE